MPVLLPVTHATSSEKTIRPLPPCSLAPQQSMLGQHTDSGRGIQRWRRAQGHRGSDAGKTAPLFCELSEGRDYIWQGRLLGYCGIGTGLRGDLIDIFPGAEDGDGRLRMTLPELVDQLRPFAVGERQIEHHHVERLAVPDQCPPFFQRAGQGKLRAVHLPENELQGLREGRVVLYYYHPPNRDTSAPSAAYKPSEHNPNGEWVERT